MPWYEVSKVKQRLELIKSYESSDLTMSELCRRYGVSRKTGYKWLKRYQLSGEAGLIDHPKAPKHCPHKSINAIEEAVLSVRKEKRWGGRKIHRHLKDLGYKNVPAPSTISDILRRHFLLTPEQRLSNNPVWHRFEHDSPNHLWQMDFKGHFAMENGRCHPLTIIDDHSRFSLCIKACERETKVLVRQALIDVFRRYGLPKRINVDNGIPWAQPNLTTRYTELSVWMIRLGIKVSYSSPRHPQTNGKLERFHRSFKQELLQVTHFENLKHAQEAFDAWRYTYNYERPHEALKLSTPQTRYQPSHRAFPEIIPEYEYDNYDMVRTTDCRGSVHYQGKRLLIGRAFSGKKVGIIKQDDGSIDVHYCHQCIGKFDKQCNRISGNRK